MIYAPGVGLAPWLIALLSSIYGAVQAGLALAQDFFLRQPKEWQYYAGVFAGHSVAATGIPNAQIIFTVAAEFVDLVVFKSPEGEGFDVFVDGVARGSFQTYAANEIWEVIRVAVIPGWNGTVQQSANVVIRTKDDQNGDSMNWFGIAEINPVTADGTPAGEVVRRNNIGEYKPWEITVSMQDSRKRRGAIKFYLAGFVTFEDAEDYTRSFIARLEPLTDAAFTGASITRPLIVSIPARGSTPINARAVYTARQSARERNVYKRIEVPSFKESFTKPLDSETRAVLSPVENLDTGRFYELLRSPVEAIDLSVQLCDARGIELYDVDLPVPYKFKK